MSPALADILTVVRLQLGLRKVLPGDRLIEDLGTVSADIVNIVVALEEKYNIEVDESALADIATIADLHALVKKHL